MRGDEALGWIGMLHPELEKKLGLNERAYLFEVKKNGALDGCLPAFKPLSKYPSIRRDIAVVVDESVSFGAIRDAVREMAPKILQDILIFDVYTGEKVDLGRKSLALGLILQETSHTLTDQEVDDVMGRVLETLTNLFSAQLRD